MSDPIRIAAQDLAHVWQLMANLGADLQQVAGQVELDLSVSVSLLSHVESDMLRVLDFISPEIRAAVARAQRSGEGGVTP